MLIIEKILRFIFVWCRGNLLLISIKGYPILKFSALDYLQMYFFNPFQILLLNLKIVFLQILHLLLLEDRVNPELKIQHAQVHSYIHSFIYLFIYLSIQPFTHLSIHPSFSFILSFFHVIHSFLPFIISFMSFIFSFVSFILSLIYIILFFIS